MDLAYDPARSNVASSGALLVDTHLQRMVNSMHRKLSFLTAALRRGSYEGKKKRVIHVRPARRHCLRSRVPETFYPTPRIGMILCDSGSAMVRQVSFARMSASSPAAHCIQRRMRRPICGILRPEPLSASTFVAHSVWPVAYACVLVQQKQTNKMT